MNFVAGPTQVYDALTEGDPLKATIAKFLVPWRAKYGERDPNWAGRGYDAVMFTAEAIKQTQSLDGDKLRMALDKVSGFAGTSGAYYFDQNHYGVTKNPYVLAQFLADKLVIAK